MIFNILREKIALLFLALFLLANSTPAQDISGGFDSEQLAIADDVIEKAISDGDIPGAVLAVVYKDKTIYKKAYGHKSLVPEKTPMTEETIFDLASITKPVATASAVMMLIERGELRLLDRVARFFPDFEGGPEENGNRAPVRLIHLLTHTSGLPAYAAPEMLRKKYRGADEEILFKHIQHVERHSAPGSRFVYSCLNFVTLQKIVEKVSGQSLDTFCSRNIFEPLGMHNTFYEPDSEMLAFCAPTEVINDKPLMGTVHDPLARESMNCVSGNAGLFSTADDLILFARMMLHKGVLDEKRILSPAAVQALTHIPQGYEQFGRALGWDVSSAYASNQGDLLSAEAYGHTGYTGTSLVIDPQRDLAIVLLTNRAHPNDKGSVVRLRSLVSNVVAAAFNE